MNVNNNPTSIGIFNNQAVQTPAQTQKQTTQSTQPVAAPAAATKKKDAWNMNKSLVDMDDMLGTTNTVTRGKKTKDAGCYTIPLYLRGCTAKFTRNESRHAWND